MNVGAELLHDVILLEQRQHVAPRPVDHQSRRETGHREREDHRHPVEDLLLHRIRLLRIELHRHPHRRAHHHRPEAHVQVFAQHRQMRRIERQQPEQVEQVRRVRRRQIFHPAVERRLPHIDGDEQHLVEREEHRELQQHRQAARGRVDLVLRVQLHHLFLLAFAIVLVEFFDALHVGLHLLHLRHRLVALVGEREEQPLEDHGRDQNGEAEIAEQRRQPFDQPEHRLGDEVRPAPIDHQVEALDARLAVGIDDAHFLGAREQLRLRCLRRVRPDRHRLQQIIRLEAFFL